MKKIYGVEVSKGGKIYKDGKQLTEYMNGSGYKQVFVKGERKFIHRMVALTYCNPPKRLKGKVVDHVNGIKTDNRFANLEWVTPRENLRRAVKLGLVPKRGKRRFKGQKLIKKKTIWTMLWK